MNTTITRYIFTALVILMAMAMFAGCVGTLDGDLLAMAAASRYDRAGMQVNQRLMDYEACIRQDNSNWDVITKCMQDKGYEISK